jgi:hypothetical protein
MPNCKSQTRKCRESKSRRRPAGAKKRRANSGQYYLMTGLTYGDFRVTGTPVDKKDLAALPVYCQAHSLLPPDYHILGHTTVTQQREALAVMDRPAASSAELLRAIVILGHSPTADALEALERHGASSRTHARMARLAATECAHWLELTAPSPSMAN